MHPWTKADRISVDRAMKRKEDRAKAKEEYFKLRKDRQDKGLCPNCGEPTDGNHVYCDAHREYRNDLERKRHKGDKK